MRISNSLIEGEVREIKPFIFATIIKNQYDRSSLFCRYQEFYESPYPQIRGKFFTIEEYMKLYTTQNKKLHFTYQSDWTGYNIPSKVLLEARSTFGSPVSQYDYTMNEIIEYCERESRIQNRGEQHSWYLIGVDKLKSGVMNHEIAHGFYFTNPHYKVEMDYLIGDINVKDYEHLKKILVKGGYSDDKCIIDDEIQAYMSTGKHTEWNDSVYQKYSQDFIKIFKKFNK